jgi:hypothetical protein
VVAERERARRDRALAGENCVGELAERDFQGGRRRGDESGAAHRRPQRARQRLAGHRVRRRGVEGARRSRGLDDPADHFDPIEPVNPGDVLPARAERTSGEKTERAHDLDERSAGALEHDPGPDDRDAYAGADRLSRLLFPVDAQLREEVRAWW